MQGKKLLNSIKLKNFLSFGEKGVEIPLEPLNVLIGPNSSGKSNFIEAIGILKAAPTEAWLSIGSRGDVNDWLWKGGNTPPIAEIDTTIEYPAGNSPLRYRLAFTERGLRFRILEEVVEDETKIDPKISEPILYYRYQNGQAIVNEVNHTPGEPSTKDNRQTRTTGNVNQESSILSQYKNPDIYPEFTYLSNQFSSISFFRTWNFGRSSPSRGQQNTSLPLDFLLEDASNLALVINNFQQNKNTLNILSEKLQKLYDYFESAYPLTKRGSIQIYFNEKGLAKPISSSFLSDGAIHFLSLLTILCHPNPPPLVCIEEPELGLHPDIIPTVAELLIEASQRTQLIVTTHSDLLVSELSSSPEAVIVCERDEDGTSMHRLERKKLKKWLEKYSLGELWLNGGIGGTRW